MTIRCPHVLQPWGRLEDLRFCCFQCQVEQTTNPSLRPAVGTGSTLVGTAGFSTADPASWECWTHVQTPVKRGQDWVGSCKEDGINLLERLKINQVRAT